MALVTLTARVDEKDKASFDAFCSNVGLNVSTAVNLFVKADPFFSDENMAYVKKSVQELREGRGTIHQLIEVDNE